MAQRRWHSELRSRAPRPRSTAIRIVASAMIGAAIVTACGSGSVAAPGSTPDSAVPSSVTGNTTTPATTAPSTTAPTTTAPSATTPSTTAPATTAPSTTAPSTTAPPATEPATTTTEDQGDPEVRATQQALSDLGYWVGAIDGQFGSNTSHAITAFQKVEGLERTGQLDGTTRVQLASAQRPSPQTTSGDAMEVDLEHQVVLAVAGGQTIWIFDVSTGKSSTPTPPGTFKVQRQIDGLRRAELGDLWRPKYFNSGIAFHGFPSVPTHAASHGCVRLTYPAMDFVWSAELAPVGTSVLVY